MGKISVKIPPVHDRKGSGREYRGKTSETK